MPRYITVSLPKRTCKKGYERKEYAEKYQKKTQQKTGERV